MENIEYSIGQISKILDVSVQAIRHYQALGLIHPARIDSKTNYRYFDQDILSDVYRIKVLQSGGFSLKDMMDLKNSTLDEQLNLYVEKSEQLENNINRLKVVKKHMEKQVDSFRHIKLAEEHIVVKELAERHGLAIVANFSGNLSEHFKTLSHVTGAYGLNQEISYQPSRQTTISSINDVSLKQLFAISEHSDLITGDFDIQNAGTYVCKKIIGDCDIDLIYQELFDYIDQHEFTIRGDAIEILLLHEEIANQHVARLRELQIAINIK